MALCKWAKYQETTKAPSRISLWFVPKLGYNFRPLWLWRSAICLSSPPLKWKWHKGRMNMHKHRPVLWTILISQKSCCALMATGRWEQGRPNMDTRVQAWGDAELFAQPLHHLPSHSLSPHCCQCSRPCELITSVHTACERFWVTFTPLTDLSLKTRCWILAVIKCRCQWTYATHGKFAIGMGCMLYLSSLRFQIKWKY